MGIPWYESLNFITGRNLGAFNRTMWGTRGKHNPNTWRGQPSWKRTKAFFNRHWRKTGGTPKGKDWVRKPSRMKDSVGKEAQARTRRKLEQYGMTPRMAKALTRFIALGLGTAGAYGYSKLGDKIKGPMGQGPWSELGRFAGGMSTPLWKKKRRYYKIMRAIEYGYRYNRRYSRYGY